MNLAYSIKAVAEPVSKMHRILNSIYTINSIMVTVLYWHGFRNKRIALLLPTFMIVAIRNTMRMCDLEDTEPYTDNITW